MMPSIEPASSQQKRAATLERLRRDNFDLVIIGGGINGAAIARDASLRGYRVALLEQADFASGTSSRSSRLVHGGLRYLEQAQIGLVFESVSERSRLARLAPHIVTPLPFVAPVYRGDRWPLVAVDLGLWIYDALALFRNFRMHRRLSAKAITQPLRGIRQEGLRGGTLYYDYQTDDARLVIENIVGAAAAGAAVSSYAAVEGFEYSRQRARAVVVRDRIGGQTFSVRGQAFISVVGPWTDALLAKTTREEHWIHTTKGVHLVLTRDKLSLDHACLLRHPLDGRVLFILPHHERMVVGTTDTDYHGDPAAVCTTAEDVRYLLAAVDHFFPTAELSPADVLTSWAGIRPLIRAEDTSSPSAVSREHRLEVGSDGITVLAGGKLTTYRRMAAQCLDAAIRSSVAPLKKKARCVTHRLPLPGAEGLSSQADLSRLVDEIEAALGAKDQRAEHLVRTYGVRSRQLLDVANGQESLREPMISGLPFIWAEVVFAVRHEMALSASDVLVRRLGLCYRAADQGLGCLDRATALMGSELGWDPAEQRRQADAYADEIKRTNPWRDAP